MYKIPTNVTLRQRQTKVAFHIRLCVLFGVVGLYLIGILLNITPSEGLSHNRNGRKLLSLSIDRFATSTTNRSESFRDTIMSTEPSKNPQNCTPPSINEFPSDGLTRHQRIRGWILIHVLLTCYCFWLLAAICDDYFVPAIELMCLKFNIQEDVAGATFMAAVTSSPELFINCVATFITKGDIGLGAVVGSAVFNILAVPACCGLLAGQIIKLDWWPLTRDCFIYFMAVIALVGSLYDGIVMWYESLFLVVGYLFYIIAMYWNEALARSVRKLISRVRRKSRVSSFSQVNEITPLLRADISATTMKNNSSIEEANTGKCRQNSLVADKEQDFADHLMVRRVTPKIVFILRWPITILLKYTIPDSRRHPRLRYITFFMAVTWIGVISYLTAYLITTIGYTLSIPDSVMGLTILAAGMSVPEAVSSIIVTNQGHGAMGISSSIGANTFDILISLGLPWFIKAFFVPETPGQRWVVLNSVGLTYSASSLLATLFGLYVAFIANKFYLDWKIGIACTLMYVVFLILATMLELNLFFDVNLPVCDS